LAWQALICVAVLSIWQWGYDLHAKIPWLVPDLLDPYFVSKPSEIFEHFLILSCLKSKLGVFNGWFNGDFAKCMARNENNLWIATAVTLKNTFFGFVTGVSSGFAITFTTPPIASDPYSADPEPFITSMLDDPNSLTLVQTIISLAHSLKLKVIAEGVENDAQMSFLRAHHCDEIQGYYLSPPLTIDKVADKLRRHRLETHAKVAAAL